MIKILLPSKNLNCYGIAIDIYIINFYADIFRLWHMEKYKFKGLFLTFTIKNLFNFKSWFFFNGNFKIELITKYHGYYIRYFNNKLKYRTIAYLNTIK